MISTQHLERYALFGGLSESILLFITTLAHKNHFASGQTIMTQGDLDNHVYFILDGRVGVWSDGVRIAELQEGQQFGEMHLIDVQPRSASIIAETEVETLSLTHHDFHKIQEKDKDAFIMILMNCARDVSRRLRAANHALAQHRLFVPNSV